MFRNNGVYLGKCVLAVIVALFLIFCVSVVVPKGIRAYKADKAAAPGNPGVLSVPPGSDFRQAVMGPTVMVKSSGGIGSGVIVERQDDAYYVVTCNHVIRMEIPVIVSSPPTSQPSGGTVGVTDTAEPQTIISIIYVIAPDIQVTIFQDGTTLSATFDAVVITTNESSDLALLKFKYPGSNLPVARIIPKECIGMLAVSNHLYTAGCPLGEPPTADDGILSRIDLNSVCWVTSAHGIFGFSGGGVFWDNNGSYYLIGLTSQVKILRGIGIINNMNIFVSPYSLRDFLIAAGVTLHE